MSAAVRIIENQTDTTAGMIVNNKTATNVIISLLIKLPTIHIHI